MPVLGEVLGLLPRSHQAPGWPKPQAHQQNIMSLMSSFEALQSFVGNEALV